MLARFLRCVTAGWLLVFGFNSTAATVSYPQSFVKGWNLVGNSVAAPLDIKASFGAQAASITSIWKWNASTSRWAFYAPSLDSAGTLASYCASKGYDVLTSVAQGEGFWVNAAAATALGTQSGNGFALTAANLSQGWNLAATGDDITPAAFSASVGNVTTLWAWDNLNNAWFFFAPSLAASNGLASYISNKGYQDFGSGTLGNGRGFWVNYAGAAGGGTGGTGTTPATTPCLVGATSSWTGPTGVTVPLSANYCFALTAPFTCDARGMGESAAYLKTLFQTVYTAATPTSITYTPSCASTPANMQTASDALMKTIDGNGTVTTLAGKAMSAPVVALVDGSATDASFALQGQFGPSVVVTDGTSLFVLDQGNYAIRKVDVATGAVTTLAGGVRGLLDGTGAAAMFYAPRAMTIDDAHANLYLIDFTDIRKIEIATGVVTTMPVKTEKVWDQYAGNYGAYITCCFINQTTGVQDKFTTPTSLAVDGNTMYVQDGARIVQVDMTTWKVSNWLSTSPASAGTMILNNGNLYFLGDKTVSKVNLATKATSLVAGGGAGISRDGIGALAGFNFSAKGLTSDGANLYVADSSAVRKIELATGIVSTLAGSNTAGYADGTGVAAKFNGLGGIAMVGTYLYAADNYSAIRRIQTNGTGGNTPAPISTSTTTTGPMSGTWSYSSPAGVAWSPVTDTTVPNGGAVYKAAPVAQDQSTIASITVTQTGNGVVSFYRKVSSLACCDYLAFTIDGVEPANARWSGNVVWGQVSFPLPVGTHTLRWSYIKGSATYVNAGTQDTAWISQVAVTAAPPVINGLAPAAGAVGSLSKILGTDLNNFSPMPTVNFTAGATSYPAVAPYTLNTDSTSLGFAVPQDLSAGDYSVTLGNGATAPQIAGTFTIPTLGAQMGGARQGVALNLGGTVSTPATLAAAVSGMTTDGKNLYVAASGIIYRVAMTNGEVSVLAGGATPVTTSNYGQQFCTPADGLGALASFCGSGQLTTDGTNLYFSDTYADLVRKIVIATGQVTTLSGLFRVNGITTDSSNIYIISSTNPQLMKIDIATGTKTVLAGTGRGYILDGTGTAASFKAPSGMTTDGINLYVTDGNTIRKVNPASGVVTTFAGSATVAGFADGVGIAATFSAPTGITTDGTSLYVTDTQHYTGSILTNSVRKIDIATGTVSTLPISSFNPLTTDGINLFGTTLVNGQYGIRKVQTARAAGASAPVIVSTTVVSSAQANLKWTPVAAAASGYNIYRSTSPGFALTAANKVNPQPVAVATLEYTDSKLASATTYYYKVTGITATGAETPASNEIWLKTLTAPAAPTGLTATAVGASKIDLSWTAVAGATRYVVYQSNAANVQIIAANIKGNPTSTSTQLSSLSQNLKYYYKVTAISATGESLGSNEVSATTGAYPAATTGLVATAVSGTQIDLSWNAVAGAVSYNVYLGSDTVLKGNTAQTTFSLTGLSIGTLYSNFFVRAVNAAGEQSLVAPTAVSAATLSLPVGPAGASATAVSGTQINLAWTAKTGETYNVYRSATTWPAILVSNRVSASPVTSGTYSDTGLTVGATYYYRVTAVNSIGEGATGSTVSATTLPPTPAAPTGLTATPNGTTQIKLAWTAVTGATSYNVYRSNSSGVQLVVANKLATASAASYTNASNTPFPLGTTYYYVITAVNAGGESLASAEVAATTPTYAAAPAGITASSVSPTQINLSWSAVTGATGYNIYTSTTAGFTPSSSNLIQPISCTPCTSATLWWDSGLTAGTPYFYRISTINSLGEGAVSAEVSATTPAAVAAAAVGTQMGGARQGVPLTLSGNITTLAGSTGYAAVNGTGKLAALMLPIASGKLATDGVNVYAASQDNVISKIDIATGLVSTLAGTSGSSGAIDAVGTAASFNGISGITLHGSTLFVADAYNRKIRTVDIATGTVSTLTLVPDAKAATYTYPSYSGITTDGTHLYVTDASYGLVRKIAIADGATTLFAGSGTAGAVNAVGQAASFSGPTAITTDGVSLYVFDVYNKKIRKIDLASATVTTLAGSGVSSAVDSTSGLTATFTQNVASGLTSDGTSLYLTDSSRVRKIDPVSGAVTTLTVSDANGVLSPTTNVTNMSSIVTDGRRLLVTAYRLGMTTVSKIE